jgi:DDE superfamily endonuclease
MSAPCARRANRFTSSSINLSAHKTPAVREFLQHHPRVRFHFTPTYSSWLNQVEIWFAKIEREVIARGIFTSVSDLARKLRRYINAYSANARPIQWKYSETPPAACAVTNSLRQATRRITIHGFGRPWWLALDAPSVCRHPARTGGALTGWERWGGRCHSLHSASPYQITFTAN